MTLQPWEGLHDAVLLSIGIDWKAAGAELELLLSVEPQRKAIVRIKGLVKFYCPRMHPWGESECVNKVNGPTILGDGISRLQIEMQSGDTIEIDASAIDLSE